MRKFFTLTACLFLTLGSFGQNLSYTGSTYDVYGEPGALAIPELKIKNESSDSVQIFVEKYNENIPGGWTCCFCYLICNPPQLDTLRIDLAPGETVNIGVAFNSDENPGYGTLQVKVKEIGSVNPEDTLNFSGTTLLTGISKQNPEKNILIYPNPCSGKVTIDHFPGTISNFLISDINGKILTGDKHPKGAQTSFDLEKYTDGRYFILISDQEGKTETHTIIKKHASNE